MYKHGFKKKDRVQRYRLDYYTRTNMVSNNGKYREYSNPPFLCFNLIFNVIFKMLFYYLISCILF